MKRVFKTAFILGAGFGKRLKPYTDSIPKPLLPLWGKPIIHHILDRLIRYGFERFIINTHHAHEEYERYFPDRLWKGRELIIRYEPKLLDTGGALKNIEDLLIEDEVILCHNGDVITTMPYDRLIDFHLKERPYITLALRTSGEEMHVYVDEEWNIIGIREKIEGLRPYQFTGIYALETESLRYLEPGRPMSLLDVIGVLSKIGKAKVKGTLIDEGTWYHVGSIEIYDELRSLGERGALKNGD